MPAPEPARTPRDAGDDDDEDRDEARDEVPAPDDPFGYLTDFDLERDDALRRLAELEAAALEELDHDDFDVDIDPNHALLESDDAVPTASTTSTATSAPATGSASTPAIAAPFDLDRMLRPSDEEDGDDDDDDDDELGAGSYERDALRDPDVVAEKLEAEDDAAFDHPSVRDAIETGSAFTSTAFADASELEDLELRHQRPSPWGRLDLTVAWRRTWTPQPVTISLGPLPHGPIAESYDTADSLLVVATWSR